MTFRDNITLMVAANFVNALCAWLIISLLSKMGSPAVVGQYALGLAVTSPVLVFAQFQLRNMLATDVKDEYHFSDYLWLSIIAAAGALCVIAGICMYSGFDPDTARNVMMIGIVGAVESQSEVFLGLFQKNDRMDRVAVSLICRGMLGLIGVWLGLLAFNSLFFAAMGLCLARILVLGAYDVVNAGRLVRKDERVKSGTVVRRMLAQRPGMNITTLAWLALPMAVTLGLNTLAGNISRYFLVNYLGEYELGLFAAASSLVGMGRIAVGAMGVAASTPLARFFAEGDIEKFHRLLLRLGALGLGLGMAGLFVAAAFGREILELCFTQDYGRTAGVLVILVVGETISYITVFGVGLTAARKFPVQMVIAAVGIVATVLLNWWLIPLGGLTGAAQAVVGKSIVTFIVSGALFVYTVRTFSPITRAPILSVSVDSDAS